MLTATDPLGDTVTYEYTPAPTSIGDLPGGLLKTVTDNASGRVTTYDYYGAADGKLVGLLKSKTYTGGGQATLVETYEYDARGNLVRWVDGTVST